MKPKRVFILGAGSSIGHSLGIFPSITGFFSSAQSLDLYSKMDFGLIAEYVEKVMGRDIYGNRVTIDIEALFTNIEIEIQRRPFSSLLEIRRQLLKLIQDVLIGLTNKFGNKESEYHYFKIDINDKDTIITFNWDTLLDNVMNRERILLNRYFNKKDQEPLSGHYWEFINNISAFGERTWDRMGIGNPYKDWNPDNGFYLKAHGSIDWFYCSNDSCRASRKVFPLPEPTLNYYCSECHEILECLIIPPVLNKEYRQYPVIRRIWNLAVKEISSSDELVIWGYSLPATDFYSDWLLRQARNSSISKLIIIDPAVYDRKNNRLRASFIRRFYNILRGKLEKESIILYDSFMDYLNGYNVLDKYSLGEAKKAYRQV